MHPLLIFSGTVLGYYQSTKLEIQENVPGLISDLSIEVQILLNITNNSKFFLLLKTVPGKTVNEYSLKISFGKERPLSQYKQLPVVFLCMLMPCCGRRNARQTSWINLFTD